MSFITFCSSQAQSSAIVPLVLFLNHHKSPDNHEGFIVTKLNDTIHGSIKLSYDLRQVSVDANGPRQYFKAKNVKYLYFNEGDNLIIRGGTEYFFIPEFRKLYRKIHNSPNIEIYDRSPYVTEKKGYINDYIVIKDKNGHFKEISYFAINARQKLVKFYNDSYSGNIKYSNVTNSDILKLYK